MALRVLIVGDDPPTVELTAEVLRAHGAEASSVKNGPEAEDLITREKFDGIFLDLAISKGDGLGLARAIRKSSWNHRTPIVALGQDDKQTMLEAFEAGATFFLGKPVDKAKLTALLDNARGALSEMAEERRRFRRVPLHTEVNCRVNGKTVTGKSANLSQDGLLFQSDGTLKPGGSVKLSFGLPDGKPAIEVEGTIVRVDEKKQVGVAFERISAADQKRILELILTQEPN